jgi:hypothetical protein
MKYPKLTTAAAMAFGPLATRNRVQLKRAQADLFLSREVFSMPAEQCRLCDGTGYVLAFVEEICLGVGLFREDDSGRRSNIRSGAGSDNALKIGEKTAPDGASHTLSDTVWTRRGGGDFHSMIPQAWAMASGVSAFDSGFDTTPDSASTTGPHS